MPDPTTTIPAKSNNKKILFIAIGAILAIAIIIGIIFVVKANIGKNNSATSNQTVKQQADDLKSQAIQAQKTNDKTKAAELLEQAKQKYEAAGDTNNAVDSDALLYLMKHSN
jgi:uncharacterized protein YybS (DUF2232 family)